MRFRLAMSITPLRKKTYTARIRPTTSQGRHTMHGLPRAPRFKPVPIVAAVVAALAGPAIAQEARPGAAQLESITVTAERRSENIKDVPNSVSAIRGELLDVLTSGAQDIRVLAARVPSLNIESSFGRAFPPFYIRGIGN